MSGRLPAAAAIAAVVLGAVSAATAASPGSESAASLHARAHSALLDLYAVDSKLQRAQTRLFGLQAQAALLRKQQLELTQQLSAARTSLHVSQRRLADNLRTLYERGDVDPIAVVFEAESLDDAMTNLDDLRRVADQSHEVVAVTSAAQTKLTRVRETFTRRSAQLSAALASARVTASELQAAHAERIAFIDRLNLKARRLTSLQAAVQHAEVKSQQLTAAASTMPAAPAPAPERTAAESGGTTLTVSSTGYSLGGHTATGLPVGWGVVAVDPTLIPLGTKLTIPGYGEAVAADTGGAVRGATIDLWFPTHAQALAWGRRTVTITLH